MKRTLCWSIGPQQENMTIEQFLRLHGCSHHILTHLKRTQNGITKNGAWAYTNQALHAGDTLEIHITEEESSPNIAPIPMALDIRFEDEDLLVLNKPGDTPIHPSIGNHENTLANGVLHYFHAQGIPFVYRCINRLDRDTSGLLIIAKNMLSGAILSRMSAARQIHREYLAIAEGTLPASGTIDAPIARASDSVIERCVDFERGETAVTHYKSLKYITVPNQILPCTFTLASVRLETGRTHQIRVHMKHIGHALAGDFLYNPKSTQFIRRQALHSFRLSFCHPITGEALDFVCEPPEDMKHLIKQGTNPALSFFT